MADNEVELTITADASEAEQGFKAVNQSIDEVEEEAKSASETMKAAFASFAGNLASGIVMGALSQLKDAIAGIPDAIGRGSTVDDITVSFHNLAEGAGISADALQSELSAALGNTIPQMDVMRQANELLIAGLKPDEITLMADAARTLGEQTGTSAAEGMDKLADSVLRGNDKWLKNLGIVVDNNKALEDFSKKTGVAVDMLNEQAKVEAIRIATLDALRGARERLGKVEDDAADKIDQIKSALQDQADEALRTIATNETLVTALGDLATVVRTMDFSPLISGLNAVVTAAATATSTIANLAAGTSDFQISIAQQTQAFKSYNSDLNSIIGSIDGSAASVRKAAKDYDALAAALSKENLDVSVIKALEKEFGEAYKEIIAAGKALGIYVGEAKKATGATNDLTGGVGKYGDGLRIATEREREAARAKKELEDALKQQRDAVQSAYEGSQLYADVMSALKDGSISVEDAQLALVGAYNETERAVKAQQAADQAFQAILNNTNLTLEERNRLLGETALAAARAAEKVDGLKASTDRASKAGESGGFMAGLGQLFGTSSGYGSLFEALAGGASQTGAILESDETSRNKFKAVTKAMGRAVAAYYTAGLSELAIQIMGESNFEEWTDELSKFDFKMQELLLLTSGFFGTAYGTQVRKAVDKFFAEAFNEQPILAVVNGKLAEINDLVFSGMTPASGQVNFGVNMGDSLAAMSEDIQHAFLGVGLAFESLLGVTGELDFALGEVFANNLGNLNNLQLAVEASGQSFENLKNAAVEAFLDGEISAAQAQDALIAIQRTAEKGIPDGLGMTVQAFENLKVAGPKGGRAVIDALQDIGYEARELNIETFPDLIANLQASGEYSAEEIQRVFTALENAGIDSVTELTEATREQLIAALAELENSKFPFAEQADEARDYAEALNSIPERKETVLRFRVEATDEDRALVQNISGRSNLGVGQPIQ